MNDQQLNLIYTAQLREWIDNSGMTQKDIVVLSRFVPVGSSLDETKLSRLIEGRPARAPRRRALIKLLSVLYALDVITCQQADTFWQSCDIGPLPDDLDWDQVTAICHQARPPILAEKTRLENDPSSASTPSNNQATPSSTRPETTHRPVRAGIAVIAATIIMMGAIVAFILIRQPDSQSPAPTPTPAASICGDPIVRVEPTFLFDQGVSLYTPPQHIDEDSDATPDANQTEGQSPTPDANQFAIGGLLIPQLRSLSVMDETGLWIGYAPQAEGVPGISHYAPETHEWVQCLGFPLSEGQVVNDIITYHDAIFLATDGAGVIKLAAPLSENAAWTAYTTDHGLPSNTIYDLVTDEEDQLWASTLEGVAVLAGEYWKVIYRAEAGKLANDRVHNLLPHDTNGNRWFGTVSSGVSQLPSTGDWQSDFTNTNGLQNIRAITEDLQGGIWIASDGGGVARYDDDQWQIFDTTNSALPSNNTQDVQVDRTGRIWVATDQGIAYTTDLGASWQIHSTLNTIALALPCPTCDAANDLWFIVRDQGLAHTDLPPRDPIVRVEQPPLAKLAPGEEYIFEVTVEVLSEKLTEGDGLFSTTPDLARSYGAWPVIPVVGLIEQGQSYTFSNVNDPIVAPSEPGRYQTTWRVWQSNRYVSDPIIIAFEVTD